MSTRPGLHTAFGIDIGEGRKRDQCGEMSARRDWLKAYASESVSAYSPAPAIRVKKSFGCNRRMTVVSHPKKSADAPHVLFFQPMTIAKLSSLEHDHEHWIEH